MFKRAFSDTLRQSGGPAGFIILLFTATAPIASSLITDADVVSWESLLAALAGFGAAALILFAYNLIATPFRIERERRVETEAKLETACADKAALEEGAKFRLEINSIGVNGDPIPGIGYPALAIVAARNIGNRPSALESWAMEIITTAGERIQTEVHHQHGPFRGASHTGNEIVWAENDAIYLKTVAPVQNGSVIRGFIACFCRNPRAGALVPGDRLRIRCFDVYGRRWEAERIIGPLADQAMLSYPGMDWKVGQIPDDT